LNFRLVTVSENAVSGILDDGVANAYLSTRNDACTQSALSHEVLQRLAMGPFGKQATRFAKLKALKHSRPDTQAFTAEIV
jgi:hypothetical protein